ncbi:MAG: hypothetical protein A3E88_00950 [Legionellales bacterium RIFCSPHIGHO2_12_FULL_35_11]|nr:MAG: hypothetical protein A3E88_00950 [Legionellales bacterium RIFCSPHIGHO2_12_FULL_35_11]
MLTFLNKNGLQNDEIIDENPIKLADALWIDLLNPSQREEDDLANILGFKLPTRAEMVEIELSSRLYSENGVHFMTAAIIVDSTSADPILDPITFILTEDKLITVRYVEPQSFKLFTAKISKSHSTYTTATALLVDLLETTIDRVADILEFIGQGIDRYSKKIFNPDERQNTKDYYKFLQKIASSCDLNTKTQESLVTFSRLVVYLSRHNEIILDKKSKVQISTIRKDIASLNQHTNFLSSKVSFLLDATLGLVSIEQNNIIKIFSVAAVIFLPPTLIASVYGMNFKFIPELSWQYGYEAAIGLIIFAAWAPYRFFKYKKWL